MELARYERSPVWKHYKKRKKKPYQLFSSVILGQDTGGTTRQLLRTKVELAGGPGRLSTEMGKAKAIDV